MQLIQKAVMANNIDKAIKWCNADPTGALPRVIKAGLTKANKGPEEIQKAIEEANSRNRTRGDQTNHGFAAGCEHRYALQSPWYDSRSDYRVRSTRNPRAQAGRKVTDAR